MCLIIMLVDWVLESDQNVHIFFFLMTFVKSQVFPNVRMHSL